MRELTSLDRLFVSQGNRGYKLCARQIRLHKEVANTYSCNDCAARVVTTVVSTAVPGRAIIDAGPKTLSSDPLRAGPQTGYGHVVEAADAHLVKLNEEHGHLDITRSTHPFNVGELLTVIPNHVCTCVNLHDDVFVLRNQEVVACWRVAARGKVR